MQHRQSAVGPIRLGDQRGFTLVELLTTMAIVGILSAIVSHQFIAYTQRAFDARSAGDLRDAATAEEAFYSENEYYASCSGSACSTVLPGYLSSTGVLVEIGTRDDDQNFDASAQHPGGEKIYNYSSDVGSVSWVPKS